MEVQPITQFTLISRTNPPRDTAARVVMGRHDDLDSMQFEMFEAPCRQRTRCRRGNASS